MSHNMNSERAADRVRKLRARDGDFCALCGERMEFPPRITRVPGSSFAENPYRASLDHIVPYALGRPYSDNSMSNLQLAHVACNNVRGLKMQWIIRAVKKSLRGEHFEHEGLTYVLAA